MLLSFAAYGSKKTASGSHLGPLGEGVISTPSLNQPFRTPRRYFNKYFLSTLFVNALWYGDKHQEFFSWLLIIPGYLPNKQINDHTIHTNSKMEITTMLVLAINMQLIRCVLILAIIIFILMNILFFFVMEIESLKFNGMEIGNKD